MTGLRSLAFSIDRRRCTELPLRRRLTLERSPVRSIFAVLYGDLGCL